MVEDKFSYLFPQGGPFVKLFLILEEPSSDRCHPAGLRLRPYWRQGKLSPRVSPFPQSIFAYICLRNQSSFFRKISSMITLTNYTSFHSLNQGSGLSTAASECLFSSSPEQWERQWVLAKGPQHLKYSLPIILLGRLQKNGKCDLSFKKNI